MSEKNLAEQVLNQKTTTFYHKRKSLLNYAEENNITVSEALDRTVKSVMGYQFRDLCRMIKKALSP